MIVVRPRGGTLPVLLYHRVGPPVPGAFPALTVSPDRFRSHVLWLHRSGYRTVRPCEWLAWARGSGAIPRRAVMITFDDGYADLGRHAFPVLREHGFSAVVFTVTRRIGQTNAWDAGYGSARLALLSAEQIRRWARDGIEFGAHTRTHVDLADAAAPLRDEVDGSADDLRGLLGAATVPFAYPWGRTSPAAEARVREAFPLAFTTCEGLNTRATDLHRLRRTMVQPDDGLLVLRLRVTFGWDPLRATRKRLRVRSRVRALLRAPQAESGNPQMPASIVHVLPTARPQAASLAGIVHGLVENLDRKRYAPEVWFLDRGGPLENGFRERGVTVRTLDWRGIRGNAAASVRLVRTLAAVRPAYLHLHAGGSTLPILGRLARAGCVIVHQHGRVRDERRAGPEVFRARGAHLVIANSRATAACVRHPLVRIVHPGTPPVPENVRLGFDTAAPVIGTACRLVPIKGVSVLLEAFARLGTEFPRARLEVAGTGPEEARLREAAAVHGMTERVRFLGWVRDLPAASAAWQVFVLPSLEEAFGIAAVEAMHLGLPVVATLVGGVPEVVEDRVTGLLVPPGDPSALAAAIGELLRSAADRRTLGDAGRRRARERFGTGAMATAMAAVYQEMEVNREAGPRKR